MPASILLAAALGSSLLVASCAPAMAADPLARYRWTTRVLVAVALDAADPALARQRRLFEAMGPEARDRDLVFVEAVGRSGEALRRALGCEPDAFAAVLVGKDGGAKLRSSDPLGADRLFPVIDAMPMRQDEARRPRS